MVPQLELHAAATILGVAVGGIFLDVAVVGWFFGILWKPWALLVVIPGHPRDPEPGAA